MNWITVTRRPYRINYGDSVDKNKCYQGLVNLDLVTNISPSKEDGSWLHFAATEEGEGEIGIEVEESINWFAEKLLK